MKAELKAEKMKYPPRRQGKRYAEGNVSGYKFFQTGSPAGNMPPLGDSTVHGDTRAAAVEFLYGIFPEDVAAVEVETASPEELALLDAKAKATFVISGPCAVCGRSLDGESSTMIPVSGSDFDRQKVCFSCADGS